PLPGSAFHLIDRPRPGHHRARPLTEGERRQPIELTVLLRERRDAPTVQQSLAWQQAAGPRARHLDPSEAEARHEASAGDPHPGSAWARAAGVAVTGENRAARHVTVRAPAARLAELFGVELERFRTPARDGGTVE